jgi:hypothetical protein
MVRRRFSAADGLIDTNTVGPTKKDIFEENAVRDQVVRMRVSLQ